MESNINWLHLPDIVWELILSNLDTKSLMKASESCKKFNYLLSDSKRLMDKVDLRIWNKHNSWKYGLTYEESSCELKLMKECLQNSARKYDSIKIYYHKDRAVENNMMDVIFEILKLQSV